MSKDDMNYFHPYSSLARANFMALTKSRRRMRVLKTYDEKQTNKQI